MALKHEFLPGMFGFNTSLLLPNKILKSKHGKQSGPQLNVKRNFATALFFTVSAFCWIKLYLKSLVQLIKSKPKLTVTQSYAFSRAHRIPTKVLWFSLFSNLWFKNPSAYASNTVLTSFLKLLLRHVKFYLTLASRSVQMTTKCLSNISLVIIEFPENEKKAHFEKYRVN